ncbi:SDR family NAD(P)-dependent oxidoreductase, partial [Myxococcota bacterium]|nr:SDR family NAD(P)-dependent oxidoreductase [Myxococcota bacterium]
MDLRLRGRKAIITGSSRGIGRAIAETLAAEGCDLAICSRGAEGVEEARKTLESKGTRVFGRVVDAGAKNALE